MIERADLSVEQLTVDVVQSREQAWVGDEADQQLAASIETDGLLQDVIVRPLGEFDHDSGAGNAQRDEDVATEGNGTEYAIVAGSRRYHAAMEAGYETVPCKIIQAGDLEAAWTSLVENTDRRELSEQEIAQQLKFIYEFVRPREEPSRCPDCDTSVEGEAELLDHCDNSDCELPGGPDEGPPTADIDWRERQPSGEQEGNRPTASGRFVTEQQALEYVAKRYLGRTDASAVSLVEGHLRTAQLPPLLQSLFKSADDRTAQEKTALENYGVDAQTTLGSGNGKSGTSREIVALHEMAASELDQDSITPTEAVLEAVGQLRFDEMSEQELRRTLREFRHEVTAEIDREAAGDVQREIFGETLQARAADLRETYEEVEPARPFKKVDVLGPETQRHSRWHAQAMHQRDASGHGTLVRELYQERLETLADEQGWE